MKINREDFRDLTRNFLEGFADEDDGRVLNEVTPRDLARVATDDTLDMAQRASDARAAARDSGRNQLTLNQGEVDAVAAMAVAVDEVWNQFRKIHSIPQKWLDNGGYDRLENTLIDLESDLDQLSRDMKEEGI